MSSVTGVVLCMSVGEDFSEHDGLPDDVHLMRDVNDYLLKIGKFLSPMKPIEDGAGGHKHPQMYIYAGGYNWTFDDDFPQFVMRLPWRSPENVVLLLQPEEGRTRVYRPGETPT